MSVRAVVAVPAAPLLLPPVSPTPPAPAAEEIEQLRTAARSALSRLGEVDTVVLLAGGDDATVRDGGHVDLAGYGHPQVVADLPVDRALLTEVATRVGAPRVRADALTGDLAVLALLVADARPGVQVLPVTVPRKASPATLAGFAMGLAAGLEAVRADVAVVVAGDLSAGRDTTSPAYLIEGAAEWDEQVVAAVADGDVETLGALGPGEAHRVAARGWAPLVVLLHLACAADLRLGDIGLWSPRGVGQLVASAAR